MASKQQEKNAIRRKLQILRTLAKSKSMTKSSIIMDTILYIRSMKLRLYEIRRELLTAVEHKQEVKVEASGEGFVIQVACRKGREVMISVLEVFDEMGLTVVQARTSCNPNFVMNAFVKPDGDQAFDVGELTRAISSRVIGNQVM